MSKYEKLGAFLLLEKLEEDKISKTFLAGHLVNNQIQEMNFVRKFDHSVSSQPEFILNVTQEVEALKSLSNPNIVRPIDLVREKSGYGTVFEYSEGKSLRSILQKCSQEGYPFAVDHALLITSRICTAIEYLHSKKLGDQRLVAGLVAPETTFVTYDGETKIVYLGFVHHLLKFPAGRDRFVHEYKNLLPPEVVLHHKVDRSSDVFGAGMVLYEMLTGESLYAKGREVNIPQLIEHAQTHTNAGDKLPVPDEVKRILSQALVADPAQRYGSIGDMRKALDEWLYTSDFAPTTFNLAFFMNSLFRETIDEEGKRVANYKKMDVTTVIKEEPPPPQKPEHPVGAEPAKDMPVAAVGVPSKETPSFGSPATMMESKEKSKTPMMVGALIAVAVLSTVGWLIFKPKQPETATPPTAAAGLTPQQQQAADAERQRLADEAQKAQEEAKKKDAELKDLQAKLDALLKTQQQQQKKDAAAAVDATAIQQLQEQAKKLEEERKRQEALAEEKLKAAAQVPTPAPQQAEQQPAENTGQQASASATVPPPSTGVQNPASAQQQPQQQDPTSQQQQQQQPAATTPAPAVQSPEVKEGDVVELTPDVSKPEITSRVNPTYPPAALAKKTEGTVILSVLVSEKGDVADVKVLRSATGLDEAAKVAVKKWKFRPAVKQGKRVKVWMTIPIAFKLGN